MDDVAYHCCFYRATNPTLCLGYCANDIQNKLDEPMPWIGMYIASASAICSLAMAADAFIGYRIKKLWVPCKYFNLNATSLTLLAVALKLTVDLTSIDKLPKVSSLVFMSTAMCNSMTSLASMDNKEIIMNLVALAILVITIHVNLFIHNFVIRDLADLHDVWSEEIAAIVFMLFLFVILCCSSLVVPTAKKYIESRYREINKIALVEDRNGIPECKFSVDELRLMIRKYWVMAETGSPQFVMARSVISATSGFMCLSMFLTLIEAHIRLHLLYKEFHQTESYYKWSTRWILYVQSSGVALGIIAPLLRWFVAVKFRISEMGLRSLRDELKIESYWTLRLVEWRERSFRFQIRHHRCRKLLHDAKRLLLNICIGVQILVVLTSKLVLHISVVCGSAILFCFHHIKILKRTDAQARGSDMSRYVLLLEGEAQLPKKILTNICNEIDKVILAGRRRQPMNLVKLLCKSENFDGVIKFDDNKEVESLHSQEPPNCWSLPVVTLTSIAIALPNIPERMFNELLSGVSEGLYFVKLIEKSVDRDGELESIRNAADLVWIGLELYHKWQDKDIQQTSQNGQTYKNVLQELSRTAKKIVDDFKTSTKDDTMQNPLNWPVKVIVANSMYRIAETIMLAQKYVQDQEKDDEEMFERLFVMISDILAACLTNLGRFIREECHNNVIEERAKRVGRAAFVLGESEEIIEILRQRELPGFCSDPAKAANIEEWRRELNPLASTNETLVSVL